MMPLNIYKPVGILLLLESSTHAFRASLPHRHRSQQQHASQTSPSILGRLNMVPISNEEIFAKAQQNRATQEEELAQPLLFDDALLSDMQAALLLLEKRVKEGPSSLSSTEVDQLDGQLRTIMDEMKRNEHEKPAKPAPTTAPPPPATSSTTTVAAAPTTIDIDTPLDEGEEYTGSGGMGQPTDTTNTYVIDGMDEMSPDEYRVALQRTVIEHQQMRKKTGVTGNLSSWNYLNSLTGETGVLKKKETEDDEEEAPKSKFWPPGKGEAKA